MPYKFNPFTGNLDIEGPIITGTVISAADGTAQVPGINFASDLNTGIYRPGADQLAISTGGTGRLFVDANGRVGVGVASSDLRFLVSGSGVIGGISSSSANSYFAFRDSGTTAPNNVLIGSAANDLVAVAGGYERLRIDSSGNVGIGTSSPSQLLTVDGTALFGTGFDTASSTGLGVRITKASVYGSVTTQASSAASDATLAYRAYKGTSKNFEVTCGGSAYFASNVGIGTTGPSELLHVAGAGATALVAASSGVGKISLTRGAVAFEAYTSTSDCYIGTTSATDFQLRANNSEAARIDTSGRLLVGTSTSLDTGGLFQVNSNTDGIINYYEGNNATPVRLRLTKSRGATTAASNDDGLGEITFRGRDTSNNLRSAAAIAGEVDAAPGASSVAGRLVFSTTADGASSPTERMTITSKGFVCPDSSSTSNQGNYLSTAVGGFRWVAGSTVTTVRAESYGNNTATRYHQAFVNPNGTVGSISTNGSATSYNTSSDHRLKENVVDIADGITRVKELQPRRFNFIADADTTVDGFLAHEAQTVVPEAVTGTHNEVDDDGNPVYQGIDQSKLVPLLTAALQEAIGEIESLKARLTAAGL